MNQENKRGGSSSSGLRTIGKQTNKKTIEEHVSCLIGNKVGYPQKVNCFCWLGG